MRTPHCSGRPHHSSHSCSTRTSVRASQSGEQYVMNVMLLTYLSAICTSLSGLKVPSVSMYIALPSPPPTSMGICSHEQELLSGLASEETLSEHQGCLCWRLSAYLTQDAQRVAQLSLATSEFAIHLCDRASLNAPCTCFKSSSKQQRCFLSKSDVNITFQDAVELLAASADVDVIFSLLHDCACSGETHMY